MILGDEPPGGGGGKYKGFRAEGTVTLLIVNCQMKKRNAVNGELLKETRKIVCKLNSTLFLKHN